MIDIFASAVPQQTVFKFQFIARMSAVESVFSPPPLHKSVGYGVIIGVGFLFAFGMIFITWALKRYVLVIVLVGRSFG